MKIYITFILSFFFNLAVFANDLSLSQKIELIQEKPYVFHPLGFTEGELQAFDAINTENATGPFEMYGKLEKLEEELTFFFKDLCDEETAMVTINAVLRVTKEILVASQNSSAWFCMRPFRPSDDYLIPRWHSDGKYFNFDNSNDQRVVCKFAFVLKGAPTLFADVPDSEKSLINSLGLQNRLLADQIVKKYKIESPQVGELAIFRVADEESAVHSEPHITTDRLFISILPGSEEEICELYNFWYPESTVSNFTDPSY